MARPGLSDNPKFRRLVHLLGEPVPHVRGYLECMWEVGYQSGNPLIGDALDVELAAQFPGTPGKLFAALLDSRFIDCVGESKYAIHDLLDNAPDYVRKRATRVASKGQRGPVVGRTASAGFPPPSADCPPVSAERRTTADVVQSLTAERRTLSDNGRRTADTGGPCPPNGGHCQTTVDVDHKSLTVSSTPSPALNLSPLTPLPQAGRTGSSEASQRSPEPSRAEPEGNRRTAGEQLGPNRFRGVDVNNPLLVAERNRLADHYRKVTRTSTTTGGREEIGDLLHAGHDPAELVRAAEIYARHCDAQKLEPARRKGAKGFYGSQAWQEILASPQTVAQPEQSLGLSQLTPIRGPLEGPGFSKRGRKPVESPEKPHQMPQDLRGESGTSHEPPQGREAL